MNFEFRIGLGNGVAVDPQLLSQWPDGGQGIPGPGGPGGDSRFHLVNHLQVLGVHGSWFMVPRFWFGVPNPAPTLNPKPGTLNPGTQNGTRNHEPMNHELSQFAFFSQHARLVRFFGL
ncbi:MAG: hypothetical protein O2917_03195 [Acidobacteria bacterium]|nr:hypothetical protein [Acidobacteriota bacterium]